MVNKPKLQVLRRRADFVELTKKGRKVHPTRWLTVNFRKNPEGQFRCGWTIPKQVGPAVVRNRLRRWCREIVREKLPELPAVDINVFFRPGDAEFYRRLLFAEFRKSFEKALDGLK